jgi:hypothetical protein
MTDEKVPPAPLPPAAESPYPDQPAPHPQRDQALEHPPVHIAEGAGIGALGATLIGGAVAAAVGLLVAIPLVRRVRKKPAPPAKQQRSPQARRPRRKRNDD